MRFVFRAMCAAALAGCVDVKTPVETKLSTFTPSDPVGASPDPRAQASIDPRPLLEQLEAMYGDRVAKVSIPADTYSRFADAVHPDIACPPATWNGAACWLMYTPYKNSDPAFENPGLLFASSDSTWETPPQVQNPLIQNPGSPSYNSDPDHAFDPATGRLVQIYRVVADTFNKIMIMSTADARQWTTPTLAFREHNHDAVSPSLIIEPNHTAKLWYVRAGIDGCIASQSSVVLRTAKPDDQGRYERATWSDATPVQLTIPGYVPWHLDVIELADGQGYLAMIAAYQKFSNCANSDVWLASSRDGISWHTYSLPLFSRTMKLAKQLGISTWYRGTMRYDGRTDVIDLWPSGLAKGTWNVYHARAKLVQLLGLLSAAQPSDFRPPSASIGVNPVPMHMP